jgi:hypothetical protein
MTRNNRAIVTLAFGEKYLGAWKNDCEANWREYGSRHGYDIICLQEPLDTSQRAQKRSPSWQKCLVLSQDFADRYQQIAWVDSDILINTRSAPSIAESVPIDRIGAVEMFCYSSQAGSVAREGLARMFDFWNLAVINPGPRDYYTKYGLPEGFDRVVQAGVMVFSPAHHRPIMEKIYYQYEEKGGSEWHYEMRPLSYELLKAGIVHWMDPRFNLLWLDCIFLHYPFLLNDSPRRSFSARARNKLGRLCGGLSRDQVRKSCLTATFLNSYFLHFGGSELGDMQTLNTSIKSWRECTI